MIPVLPDWAFSMRCPVDRERATNRQAAQTAVERTPPISFGDEMNVVGLHREVEHAERSAVCSRDRLANLRKETLRS
jgi:hypothetical protein